MADTPVTTRPAGAPDEAAIRACARSAYDVHTARIGRPPAPMTADFAGQIARGQIHVAVDGVGRVLGYVAMWPDGAAMHLSSVAVLPDMAGRGVGRALIALCEARARASGLTRVELYANAAMAANLTLYPHLGCHRTGRRMDGGFDRVFFAKTLD